MVRFDEDWGLDWPRVGPDEAPPSDPVNHPLIPTGASALYRVDPDWRRDQDGDWYRNYRVDSEEGLVGFGRARSPLGTFLWSEEYHSGLPMMLLVFGPPTGVVAAVALVAVGAASPSTAVAAGVVGIPAGMIAGRTLPGLLAAANRRLEAPGNLAWRHGGRAVIAFSRLSLFLPAVATTAAAIAFANRRQA